MRKRIKSILFLGIFLLNFLSIQAISTDVLSFYTDRPLIEGITTRIEFTTDLRIKTDNTNKGQYIDFKDCEKYNRNPFIKYENIKILGKNSTSINFSDNRDTLEFRIKGTLIFHWNNYNKNYQKKITLGKIYSNKKEIGTIDIVLDKLNIVSSLKVNVRNHMDFGTIVSGQKASTKELSRTPAEIEIAGSSGQQVKITIPNSIEIKNNTGDSLLVNLQFRENQNLNNSSGKKNIVKNILPAKNGVGKTDLIKIDGSVTTKQKNYGTYKGTFIVRIEYE